MKRSLLFLLFAVWTVAGIAQLDCNSALEITAGNLDDTNGGCVPITGQDNSTAVAWEVSPGLNFVGNCWAGSPDSLHIMFYHFVAQGVSGEIDVLNAPDNFFFSVIEFTGANCDGLNAVEIACGDNTSVTFDNELTIGTDYYVLVASANNSAGTFDLCVFNPVPAPNDECINAIDLTNIDGSPCNTGQDNYYPSSELLFPGCWPATATQTVWFSFVAQGVSIADLHIDGAPDNANIAVWDFNGVASCDLNAGFILPGSCGTDVDANNPIVLDNELVIGNVYHIAVSFDNNATGSFDLCLDAPVPAYNDECVDAEVYPPAELSEENNCLTTINGNMVNNDWPSSEALFPPCWDPAFTTTVWYQFEAQGPDVDITVDMAGEDQQIAILDFPGGVSCDIAGAVSLECTSGDDLEFDNQLIIGNTYYVVVGFIDDAVGDFCINIFNPVPPDNDTVCAAIPLMTDGSCNSGPPCVNDCFTTEYANSEIPVNNVPAICQPFVENSVWFTIQLADPVNVGFIIDLTEGTGENFGVIIATFDDCSGEYDPIALFCDPITDPLEFGPVDETETYYVMVGSTEDDEGTFSICVEEIPPCFDNNFCEDPLALSSANDMGELVTVSPDGTGGCAPGGSPFTCVEGCNLFADEIEYGGTCLDVGDPVVWYTFQTDANAGTANINLTSDDFDAPAFQLFLATDGSCGSLVPFGPCAEGSGGEASATGIDVGAGQVYYIVVGGINTAGGDFELCISILENLSSCTLDADVTVTNRSLSGPLEGPFFPGETVSVCMNVNTYTSSGNGCQWLQGVIPTFGNGWDPASFDGNLMPLNTTLNGTNIPAPGIAGGATWDWFEDVTYHHDNCFYNVGDFDGNGTLDICNALYDDDCMGPGLVGGSTGPCWQDTPGNILPPGWFAYGINGLCPTPGHPTVDYGDGTCCSCNMGPWEFCFDLIVRSYPDCDQDATTIDLSLGFVTVADGEVGSWNGGASICANDEPVDVKLPGCCTELEFLTDDFDPFCEKGIFSWFLDYPEVDYWEWTSTTGSSVTGNSSGEGPNGTAILDNLVNTGSSTEYVTYNLLGFDGGACPAVIWTVEIEIYPPILVEMEPFVACATPTNPYEIIPVVTGGDPGSYVYEWHDGSSDPTFSVTNPQAGLQYSVIVSDAFGCEGEASIVLEVYSTFPVDITASALSQCLVDGDIDLSASAEDPGIPAFSFEWTSPGDILFNGDAISVNESGQWSVIATDNEGCIGEDSVTIMFNESPVVEVDPVAICEDSPNPQQVIAIVNEGTQPYYFFWETPGGTFTNSFIIVDEVGPYAITVTDANGCTGELAFDVQAIPPPMPNLGADITVCLDELASGVDIGVIEEPGDVFSWNTTETTSGITVTDIGNYEVEVTNDGGCVGVSTINISLYDPVPDLFSLEYSFCEGGFAEINAPPGYSYYFEPGGSTDILIIPTSSTVFVTVTDVNGCTNEEDFEVVESSSLAADMGVIGVVCSGGDADLFATHYDIMEWYSDAALTSLITTNVDTLTVNAGGWYYIQVSDGNGCFGVDSVEVVESNPTTLIIGDPAICDGESALLDAGIWSGIEWSTGHTSATISTDTAGIFTVTVTDDNGCTAVSPAFAVGIAQAPVPDITGDATFCQGGLSTISAGGPFDTYVWSTTEVTQSIDVNSTGTYSVTVTNSEGCEGVDMFDVTELAPPVVEITGDSIVCNNTAVSLDAGAGYVSYAWSVAGAVTQTINTNAAGIVSVTVTDNSGCTAVDQIEVLSGSPVVAINGIASVCEGGNSTITATAGFSEYLWTGGQLSDDIIVDTTGTYFVTVTDALGCTGTASFDFTVNPNPSPTITGSTTFCAGENSVVDAGGGYVTYNWSGGLGIGQNATISVDGTYTVTVTDANGCTGTDDITVIESTDLVLSLEDTAICTGDVITLSVGAFDTYLWSPGNEITPTIDVSAGGTYSVMVTSGSCNGSGDIVVTEYTEPFAVVTNNAIACNTAVDGSTIDFATLITSGDASGTWADIDGSGASGAFPVLDFDGIALGNYTFEYTTGSAQGPCANQTYSVEVTIENCVCPSPLIDPASALCADAASFNLESLFIIGGAAPTQPGGVWTIITTPAGSNPATLSGSTFDGTGADAGIYEVQYTISGIPLNCLDNDVQQIVINETANAGLSGDPAQVCVGDAEVITLEELINGEEIGGSWIETSLVPSQSGFDDINGFFDTELELPGTYTFEYVIAGTAPCPDVSTFVEVVVEDVPFADAGLDALITCENPVASLDGGNSSQGGSFVYTWKLDGMVVATGNLEPSVNDQGTYELEVLNTLTGCISYDYVDVTIDDDVPVMVTDVQLPVCVGDAPGSALASVTGGTGPFTYSLNGSDQNSTGSYTDLAAGDYTLLVEDANGCTDQFEFTVNPTTEVDGLIEGELVVKSGEEVVLTYELLAGIVDSVVWTDENGTVLCDQCETLTMEAVASTALYVTLFDANGCNITIQASLVVRISRDVFVPNVFSPNGDDANDIVTVYGKPGTKITKFEVFSRWGELVHSAKEFDVGDQTAGWDGKFGGETMTPGVFVYHAQVVYADGHEEIVKGDITLIK